MGKKEKAASAAQMRKIYALARERGMDGDLLQVHIGILTGKASLKEITVSDGIRIIDSLEEKRREAAGKDGASPRQLRYIYGLMGKIGWTTEAGEPDTDRLDRFLQSPKAGFNLGSHKWLMRSAASRLIEALKDMDKRLGCTDRGRSLAEGGKEADHV